MRFFKTADCLQAIYAQCPESRLAIDTLLAVGTFERQAPADEMPVEEQAGGRSPQQ